MPPGRIHEPLSFLTLFILIYILHFYKFRVDYIQFSGAWLLGTLYLSPDLDAPFSRSKGRIKGFRLLFTFCRHRGTLHNPFFWISIFLVLFYNHSEWIGAGLLGSSGLHIIIDKL